MTKVLVFAQGRMASSRLPNKSSMELAGYPVFHHVLERAKAGIPWADHFCVLTTRNMTDDPMAMLARELGWDVFRWVGGSSCEIMAAQEHYGLGPNDIHIALPCDAPLVVTGHLGFATKMMDKYGADRCWVPTRSGTLAWGAHWCGPTRCRLFREQVEGHHCVRTLVSTFDTIAARAKNLLCRLPEEYYQPWPYGRICLDIETQAMALKEIYQRLYRGRPLDVLKIPELYRTSTTLARLVRLDAPESTNPQYPTGYNDAYTEEVRNWGNYVEVEWKEERQVSRCVE